VAMWLVSYLAFYQVKSVPARARLLIRCPGDQAKAGRRARMYFDVSPESMQGEP
jgi:hypothetical protein